jgi:hypothetical protein
MAIRLTNRRSAAIFGVFSTAARDGLPLLGGKDLQ